MKAGVIGKIKSGNNDLEGFTTSIEVQEERFGQLTQSIQVTGDVRLPDGRTAQTARAAIEDLGKEENSEISDDGEIRTYEDTQKIVKTTDLLFVPGSFVAVNSSSGRFAFQLITENTSASVERLEFDIDSYVEKNPEANPWKVGFHEYVGNANNGVIHGEQLLTDPEISEILTSAPKNQIGFEYEYNGNSVKNFVTESGYAQIYQPTDFNTGSFAKFVEQELMPHGYIP